MIDPVVDGAGPGGAMVAKLRAARPALRPYEPTPTVPQAQAILTERYLLPALAELEAFFLAVRAAVDAELQHTQPIKLGKPYPLGQCLEITLAAQRRLRRLDELLVGDMAARGRTAFSAFLRAGGTMRQVWGDLRGQYFQNAFQLGALYLDVSNDTVTPTKPKVEILPFADARFVPIADFVHFSRIAQNYWKGDIYPNHVVPALAPYFPLIHIGPQGHINLCDPGRYMMAVVTEGRFHPGEEVLRTPAMPAAAFDAVARALGDARLTVAASAEMGRQQALRFCRDYRAKRWHQSPAQTRSAIQAGQRANLCMQQWHANAGHASSPPPHTNPPPGAPLAPASAIDSGDYDLATLSDEARAQLRSLQFVDAEMADMRSQLAVLHTARMAYADALKAALPLR